MVWVGLAVVLGDVRRRLELPRVGGRLDCYPERLGAEVVRGGAPVPPLGSAGLRLSVAPGLDGIADVAVVADMVVRGGTPRGKLAPSLLTGLGTPGPWTAGATTRGVAAAFAHW